MALVMGEDSTLPEHSWIYVLSQGKDPPDTFITQTCGKWFSLPLSCYLPALHHHMVYYMKIINRFSAMGKKYIFH